MLREVSPVRWGECGLEGLDNEVVVLVVVAFNILDHLPLAAWQPLGELCISILEQLLICT